MRRAVVVSLVVVGLLALGGAWLAATRGSTGVARRMPRVGVSSRQVEQAEAAILRMDLEEAERLLSGSSGPAATQARARLAIYRADCEGAAALLGSSAARAGAGGRSLGEFAKRCAGATLGGHVVEDAGRGIWIRFQDRADEVLFPLLSDTIERARTSIEKDLGSPAPRPLRLDLVRDSFSLSAVSDLPLEAAETTGTVAVARWGRVTMLSPRAMMRGYPWQDTMAHEITHLVLSRATSERAPLWLQEGVAKRQETRWRDPRPRDRSPEPSQVAFLAERRGQAVGVDRLGPSIAMLPSADAAGIAFAEVTSFVEFWLEAAGTTALPALLRDLEAGVEADAALRGVSGLGLGDWQVLWRDGLRRRYPEPSASEENDEDTPGLGGQKLAVAQRLVELLFVEGFAGEARQRGAPEMDRAPRSALLGFLVARAALAAGEEDWPLLVAPLDRVDGLHGGFLALSGRRARDGLGGSEVGFGDPAAVTSAEPSRSEDAEPLFAHALALDPLLPEVACEGEPFQLTSGAALAPERGPKAAERRRLCEHTRSLPVRGSD